MASELVWFDIPVKNFKRAKAFYGKLFGWKFEAMGDSYWMIRSGQDTIGGLRPAERKFTMSEAPISYFGVPKLDPAVKKAKALGAKLIGKRVEIPHGMGCFHLLRDPDSNLFGIWAQN